jgi:hypothetical protein
MFAVDGNIQFVGEGDRQARRGLLANNLIHRPDKLAAIFCADPHEFISWVKKIGRLDAAS